MPVGVLEMVGVWVIFLHVCVESNATKVRENNQKVQKIKYALGENVLHAFFTIIARKRPKPECKCATFVLPCHFFWRYVLLVELVCAG